jgi:ESS family glutamate:Na+ symporter
MTVALIGAGALLVIGRLLRRIIPARGVLLTIVPAAILGGLIALLMRSFELLPGSPEVWQDAAYHLFGIAFLAIGLTPSGNYRLRKGAVWMGVGQWATFSLQAAAGGLVAVAYGSLHVGFGFLAPMGLNEGPGQAVSVGRLWEGDYGFANAASIGATIASVGFLIAYLGGLLVVRGRSAGGESVATGYGLERFTAAMGVAVVAGYVIIYQVVFHGLGAVDQELRDLVLGVLFFFCLLIGMGVRSILAGRGVAIDGSETRKVAVVGVDALTVAILGSLTWEAISSVFWPLVVVTGTAVIATVCVLLIAGRWAGRWRSERSLALFGTVTGTAASGLALLALADPDLESPVAAELGAMVVVSAPVVLGGIALATAAASGSVAEPVAIAIFVAVGALSVAVLAVVVPRMAE